MFDSAALRVMIVQTHTQILFFLVAVVTRNNTLGKSHFRRAHHQAIHSKVREQNLVWLCTWSLHYFPAKLRSKWLHKHALVRVRTSG